MNNEQRQEKLERKISILEKLSEALKAGSTINRSALIKELYYLDTTTKGDSLGMRETRETL